MSSTGVSTLDLRVVERVLEMGRGYVLDFSDRTFAEFLREFSVDIDDPRYSVNGTSKAKRLRFFLTTTAPPRAGRVLGSLLQHRLAWKPEIAKADLAAYREVAERLGWEPPSGESQAAATEKEITGIISQRLDTLFVDCGTAGDVQLPQG